VGRSINGYWSIKWQLDGVYVVWCDERGLDVNSSISYMIDSLVVDSASLMFHPSHEKRLINGSVGRFTYMYFA
jgi:hypothetical protein